MRYSILFHVLMGAAGLAAGYAALFSKKGGRLHRRSGMLFVFTMTLMAFSGAAVAAALRVEASVVAGLSTGYLVITAWTTVRPRTERSRRLDLALAAVGLTVGTAGLLLGIDTMGLPGGERDDIGGGAFFVVGIPALAGGLADLRMIRAGGLKGGPRMFRHVWRSCFALLVAAGSFFLGQADKFPAHLRHPALLAAPVLVVALMMAYWLWRVRGQQLVRGAFRRGARSRPPRPPAPVRAAASPPHAMHAGEAAGLTDAIR